MKHLLFRYLKKSRKLPSKRIMIAGVAVISILLIGTLAASGYLLWTAGTYAISEVQKHVPQDVPANIDSTLKKIQEGQVVQTCKNTVLSLFALGPWLTQPLGVTLNKLKMDCWPGQSHETPQGEHI